MRNNISLLRIRPSFEGSKRKEQYFPAEAPVVVLTPGNCLGAGRLASGLAGAGTGGRRLKRLSKRPLSSSRIAP